MNSPAPMPPEWSGQPIPGSWQQQQWYGACGAPAGWRPYPPDWVPGPLSVVRRPGTLIAGLVMTYIGAGLLVLGGLGLLIGAANGEIPSGFVSGFAGGLGVSKGSSMGVIVAVAFMVLVFSAILILPAVLAHKGISGGRTALTVIGGLRLALDVFMLTQGNVRVVPSMVWIAVAVGLLWTWQANAWFRYKAHARGQGQ